MSERETRRKVLLAATLAHLLGRRGRDGATTASPWARTNNADLRGTAWNPRRGAAGWRLDGRLRQHDANPL